MEALEEDTPGNGAASVALDLTGILHPAADVEERLHLLFGKSSQRGALLLWNIVNGHPGVPEGLQWILLRCGHLFSVSS
jgi:hypothetical protein